METLASLRRQKRSRPPRPRAEYHADFEDVAETEVLAPPQSKRKRAASASSATVTAAASLEDQPLIDIIKHDGRLISHAIKKLVADYESKKKSVMFQILTMLFEACGAKHEIYFILDIWDNMKMMKETMENSRREITSALWTKHPQLLRKFIYDRAKISPLVDMMTLLKLELYSYKRQEHFKAVIDLITDAFFKHGEKGPLRFCIKAITFFCTECQTDLKDYAENKLKNLEDELVLKVRTAMKEVEAGDDEYSLLVNLKRLYELQLSNHVKNDSLFEDMYRILAHLSDIDNEVKIFLLLNMYLQVASCLHAIDSENPSQTCIDELLSMQSSLFDQLYYYLAVLPTYQKERSTTVREEHHCTFLQSPGALLLGSWRIVLHTSSSEKGASSCPSSWVVMFSSSRLIVRSLSTLVPIRSL